MTKKLSVALMCAGMLSCVAFAGIPTPPDPVPVPDPTDEKGRWIVCHKEKKTLAVEGDASKADHLGHGDTVGEC